MALLHPSRRIDPRALAVLGNQVRLLETTAPVLVPRRNPPDRLYPARERHLGSCGRPARDARPDRPAGSGQSARDPLRVGARHRGRALLRRARRRAGATLEACGHVRLETSAGRARGLQYDQLEDEQRGGRGVNAQLPAGRRRQGRSRRSLLPRRRLHPLLGARERADQRNSAALDAGELLCCERSEYFTADAARTDSTTTSPRSIVRHIRT